MPMPIMLWIVAIIEGVIENYADMGILLGIQVCAPHFPATDRRPKRGRDRLKIQIRDLTGSPDANDNVDEDDEEDDDDDDDDKDHDDADADAEDVDDDLTIGVDRAGRQMINAFISFYETTKASDAVEALKVQRRGTSTAPLKASWWRSGPSTAQLRPRYPASARGPQGARRCLRGVSIGGSQGEAGAAFAALRFLTCCARLRPPARPRDGRAAARPKRLGRAPHEPG